jgi:parallel beta-helix repeat protein
MEYMKRLLSIGIILLFIGLSISSSTGFNIEKRFQPVSSGKTLYVGGSGPGNYTKIQDAIDNASDGDTVFVYDDSSPYYEFNITIDKSINLIGEDRNTTIICGDGNINHILLFDANGILISGFTLKNNESYPDRAWFHYIIKIQSSNNTIYDNYISGFATSGILINKSEFNNISTNVIDGEFNNNGIQIEDSTHITLFNNYISAQYKYGIEIHYSKNVDLISNTITDCITGLKLLGVIDSYIYGNILTHNAFVGITLSIFSSKVVIHQNNISFNGKYGIYYTGYPLNDKITMNNFIGNEIKNVRFTHPLDHIIDIISFDEIKPSIPKIIWNENYWDNTGIKCYYIIGRICLTYNLFSNIKGVLDFFSDGKFSQWFDSWWYSIVNWIYIDWHPAQEPYDIGG